MTHAIFTPLLCMTVFAFLAAAAGWLAAKPVHAAALLLGLVFLDALHLPLVVNFGLSLYPEDLFFLILASACMVRFCLFASPRAVPWPWWVLGMIQLGLAVWGVKSYGTSAGVDARGHFYLWITLVFFASVRWSDRMVSRIVDLWIACGAGLCMLAIYRWGYSALDPRYAEEIMAYDTTGVRFRVISSASTLVIAIGSLGLLFRIMRGRLPLPLWPLLPVQLAAIAVLQHRSVWISLFVGVACLMLVRASGGKRIRALPLLGVVLVPLVLVFALPADNSVIASVRSSADQAVSTKEGTMVGRVVYWDELMAKWLGAGIPTYLVGQAYGGGFSPSELDDGTKMDMVPHNHFLHILFRGGVIGLLATLWVFGSAWRAAFARTRQGDRYWAHFLLAAMSALYAYYIPYWANYDSGLLLGLAIGYLRSQRQAPMPIAPSRTVPRFAAPRLPASFRIGGP
ncbi:O-antigen ligase family protein [Massilia aerilata]|uniref:O-antigen ligase family protein n=1 Tax=Massilia aerilata TaxID=453817 RepID=A0ABW0S412_9BURK